MIKKSTLKKVKKTSGVPLAVVGVSNKVCMFLRSGTEASCSIFLSWSSDGLDFVDDDKKVSIEISARKKEKIENCKNFSVSVTPTGFVMVYVRKGGSSKKLKTGNKSNNVFVIARSTNLYKWTVKSEIPNEDGDRAAVVYNKYLDLFEFYKDGLFIKNQPSRTLSIWKEKPSLLFTSRFGMFDQDKISIMGSLVTSEGMLLMYDASIKQKEYTLLQAGAVLFDIKDPKRVIWRSETPLWQGLTETKNKKSAISPLGFVYLKDVYVIYWVSEEGNLIVATFPALFKKIEIPQYKILEKFERNPILKPRSNFEWEANGTFNPAVFQDESGTVHLLYRALGQDGISRVGYAQSKDGLSFTKRLSRPVFEPSSGYGLPDERTSNRPVGFHPAIYTSGGGWGGSEDPRVVRIDNRIYMIYVAFEGWQSVRIALTSISVQDFKSGKWNWKKPALISPPGHVNKNWLIFPEKINGKFAILHTITPKIMVEYVDDLDNIEKFIESPRMEGPQPGRKGFWDNRLRGAGPPPIKTPLGWLMLYHALDEREPHKYKLGAMILDKNDPTKILYRSNHPILYPDMWYENEGKPGIVYASGAIVRGDDLYVYYGGGDRVVCVAITNLKSLLEYLVTGKPDNYQLQKVSVSVQ